MSSASEGELTPPVMKAGTKSKVPFGLLGRLAPARLTGRIVLINIVGLIILLVGIFYSNYSRDELINARQQSLMTQARIMAAAVAGSATVDTGQILIDPDRLLKGKDSIDHGSISDEANESNQPIAAEHAGPVLRELARSTGTRARIYDRDGGLVVDSRHVYGRGDILRVRLPSLNPEKPGIIARSWNWLTGLIFVNHYPLQKEYGLENGKEFPEVTASLTGAHVSVIRKNDKDEIIVTVAVPIQRFRAVLGSLVLSTKGGEIDDVLAKQRRIIWLIFFIAASVAILLSVALASHIAEPIRRLASSAEQVRHGVDNRVEIPDFSNRSDEIGHLSGALRDMTEALYKRIDAIEAFAADVSHELKNPLTSLRSAVESLQYAKTTEQKDRLSEIITDDVLRLNRLITDISDASRLDAELARAQVNPVDVAEMLRTFVSITREVNQDRKVNVELDVKSPPVGMTEKRAYSVSGHDTRLGQVVHNLINNAISFSPDKSTVKLTLRRVAQDVVFTVEDSGPGLNPDHLERIFRRFYTDRPEGSFGKNSGLGLSISKQIVDAHGGLIWADNRLGEPDENGEREVLGARFVVQLPALGAGKKRKG